MWGAAGAPSLLGRGRPVGVPQHWVEGAGEVVGLGAAVVLFGGGQQAGQEQQQQQQQLEGQRCPQHAGEEGALWPGAAGAGHPAGRETGRGCSGRAAPESLRKSRKKPRACGGDGAKS